MDPACGVFFIFRQRGDFLAIRIHPSAIDGCNYRAKTFQQAGCTKVKLGDGLLYNQSVHRLLKIWQVQQRQAKFQSNYGRLKLSLERHHLHQHLICPQRSVQVAFSGRKVLPQKWYIKDTHFFLHSLNDRSSHNMAVSVKYGVTGTL